MQGWVGFTFAIGLSMTWDAGSGFSSSDCAVCSLTGGGEEVGDRVYALTSGVLEGGGGAIYA